MTPPSPPTLKSSPNFNPSPLGCRATKLVHAIAIETNIPFYKISATEVIYSVSSASKENSQDKAYNIAPSFIFINEIDAIASKRGNLKEMKQRIVTQLMTCMDESPRLVHSVDAIIRAIFHEEPTEEEMLFNNGWFYFSLSDFVLQDKDLFKGKECYII